MPPLETRHVWSFTSSGAGTAQDAMGYCYEHSWYLETGPGTTATIAIETARNSTAAFARLNSTTYALSTGSALLLQTTGPLLSVRPYVVAMTTGTVTVELIGV